MSLLSITWNADPEIFNVFGLSVRWYGLLWAVGFLLGYEIMRRIFARENMPEAWLDKLFVYVFVGSVVGARLGHCLFYEWSYYSKHLLEILFIWQGGLASHGGAIGILLAVWLFSRNVSKKSMLWLMDRLAIPIALVGALIRLGNLMNSEIYGTPTTMPWGFIFVRNGETVPMHPTQIYEMLYCLVTFAVLVYIYLKTHLYQRQGFAFGVALVIIFLSRFLLEFLKNDQADFEATMLLNMGQLLSLPFIVLGLYFMIFSKKRKTT
ncbi:MAG: prolipoprotein diacylglyceryl transferase [Prevotellaceae bacterium]|jgi:prolipoprotein diacylglyceryl transferase|nr:prolipoprotein diacylglyceryl transferase [Prevotellaceae bacterium]